VAPRRVKLQKRLADLCTGHGGGDGGGGLCHGTGKKGG
jgi:hypothetical protein